MGCRSEYMEPNEREAESILVCQLLNYLLAALGLTVPKHIARGAKGLMDGGNNSYGSLETLDADTAKLCSTLKGLTKKQADKIVYDGRNADARKLAEWWDHHQEADRNRKAEERAAKRNKTLRKQALAKLTPAERKALKETE